MQAHETAALSAIHGAFAETVTYNGAGLTNAPVPAAKSDGAAMTFQGPGNTLRQVSFEIPQASLPQEPAKGNTITEADGMVWKANDITRRDDVAAWVLIVEEQ